MFLRFASFISKNMVKDASLGIGPISNTVAKIVFFLDKRTN